MVLRKRGLPGDAGSALGRGGLFKLIGFGDSTGCWLAVTPEFEPDSHLRLEAMGTPAFPALVAGIWRVPTSNVSDERSFDG